MTDHRNEQSEATKKRLADEASAREKKQAEQRDALGGVKPTPTQMENDLTASGEHVTEHADDGSGPDPNAPPAAGPASTRQSQPSTSSRSSYSTRAASPSQSS